MTTIEPAHYDITIYQGATWTRALRLIKSDGTLLDTTNWYAWLAVRAGGYDGPIVIYMQNVGGRIQTGLQGTAPDQYNVLLNLTAAVTKALVDWGEGVYTFDIQDPYGTVYRYLEGRATLSRTAVY